MAKLILLLGLVVLSCCAPSYAFEYLGFYGNSKYWISDDLLPETGQITPNCVANFGKGSIVVSIDNNDEWGWIQKRLAEVRPCKGCVMDYWTSGKWDVSVTSAADQTVLSISGKTVTTKILKKTNQLRFICETPVPLSVIGSNTQEPPAIPTPVTVCLNENDVIFVLDSSASVGASYYKKAKVFVYDLARAFVPTSRFGFTIFSSSARIIRPLDNNLSAADLFTAILNADYMAKLTFTNLAIDSAVAEFAASTRKVTKNLVILTDGGSTNRSATLNSIRNAIDQGIRTFAVGVGSSTIQEELLALAGGNIERLFTASSFDELTPLLYSLTKVTCEYDTNTHTNTNTYANTYTNTNTHTNTHTNTNTNTNTCYQDMMNINSMLDNEQKLALALHLLCTCNE